MRAGRSEALDLFRKWCSERALLRCDFGFAGFAACLRGRIVSVSENQVKLLSDDAFSELVLPLASDLGFGFGDPRRFPEEAEVFESGLVVFFARARPEDDFDTISFLELKDAQL